MFPKFLVAVILILANWKADFIFFFRKLLQIIRWQLN